MGDLLSICLEEEEKFLSSFVTQDNPTLIMMMTSRLIDERLHFDVNYQQEISKKKFSC
jgi:hypothetical protein